MNERAARLLETLEASAPGRRVPLERVREAFHRLHPHLQGSVSSRAELAEVVQELADAGAVTVPRGRALYDDVQSPPLPRWIQLGGGALRGSPVRQASEVAWCPELAFVLRMEHLTRGELRDLLQIQEFFRGGREAPAVTARERSVELFGDEKRLEQLAAGRLFGTGRLSLEMLRCEVVHPPFAFKDLGRGTRMLVVENKDTFHSACRAAVALEGRGSIRWVAYGSGRAILSTLESVREWAVRPEEALYFGDLDVDGLEIAIGVVELAARWRPPLRVLCAGPLYRRLAWRGQQLGLRLEGRRCSRDAAQALAAWVPEDIRPPVAELLERGGRWPQETVSELHLVELLASC